MSIVLVLMAGLAVAARAANLSKNIEPGTEFSLRAGESALLQDGSLQVRFDRVRTDSRCPKREQCVVAGEATVLVRLQPMTGASEQRELRLAPGRNLPIPVAGRFLRLLRLEPVPVTGQATRASDYVATFEVTDANAGQSDR